ALANSCREWVDHSIPLSAAVAGIEDSLALARDALQQLPDDRRTQIIVRDQLVSAVDAFTSMLATGNPSLMESSAATMVDIARTLINELGDDSDTDLLFWAEAAQRSIQSWRRDADQPEEARRTVQRRLAAIESASRSMAQAMEFGFLLDPERRLLSI